MKRGTLVLVLGALVAGSCLAAGDEPPKKGLKGLMEQKLKHAQRVLEGVALKDFPLIANQAEELIAISKAAEWRVFPSPAYERYTNEFRRNAEELIAKAKEKNLDGATLAYVNLTLSCVKCHQYVRDERRTRLDGKPPDAVSTTGTFRARRADFPVAGSVGSRELEGGNAP